MDRSARTFALSSRRIFGMVRRHFYLLRGSLPRILEMAYWPTVQMVIWGFSATKSQITITIMLLATRLGIKIIKRTT